MIGWRRHWRFLTGLVLGAVAFILLPWPLLQRLLAAADVLFAVYLIATWIIGRNLSPADLRAHARTEDEGAVVVFGIALAAVAASLAGIFDALHGTSTGIGPVGALISVPLGWLTVHTLFALRYAHLWYSPDDDPRTVIEETAGGLDFGEATTEPGLIEFLYYSFTIGMTAQTSDVAVTTSQMRRLTLTHAGVSFLYNTVLIALSVNAAMGLAGSGGN